MTLEAEGPSTSEIGVEACGREQTFLPSVAPGSVIVGQDQEIEERTSSPCDENEVPSRT